MRTTSALVVPHTAASARSVRRLVGAELTARRLPPAAVDDVVLIATELVGNAVRHADPLPGGVIEVQCQVEPTDIRLEVVDGGAASCPEPRTAGADETGGRGLAIVDQIAGEWGVETRSAARSVWAIVRFPAAPRFAAPQLA